MESSSKDHASLHCLPVELLEMIIRLLSSTTSLKPLSMVNRVFRQLCVPFIFRTLRISYSTSGLNCLVEASHCSIAPYVKAIRYEISERIDPLAQNWETFCTYLYTPTEYARDRRDSCWAFEGGEVSYSTIYSYFSFLAKDQQEIIQSNRDLTSLCTSLPLFTGLDTIQLCFSSYIKPPFDWCAERMLLDGQLSFPRHVEVMATAIAAAKRYRVAIRTLIISGFYPRVLCQSRLVTDIISEAFSDVKELQLHDSPAILNFFEQCPLPQLERFEIGCYWMSVSHLERFIYAHARTIKFLHLEDIWLFRESREGNILNLTLADTRMILDSLTNIRCSGILSELTINRKIDGCYEIKESFA
ncbi:hypothetical protein AARAC_010515 [Aspergillus arachidicola]|uniref:F-box domain-containing protein n=1 Tax=Aspergillus arachidicola TaxID=656916 RepID=A0A2G7FMY3_9EURO|nr:hypothetical protein AARAC_010515 [Aspergillus arachidicola]